MSIYHKVFKKNRKLYNILSFVKSRLYSWKNNLISTLFLFQKVDEKKIVFSSFYGEGYGDNGKYIVEEMLRQNLKYDIVWLTTDTSTKTKKDFPEKVRIVKYDSIKGLYELSTAKIWIDNCRKTFHPIKKRDQLYINTGHGGIPLKKIEESAKSTLSPAYIKNAKIDSKMTDIMISNSSYKTRLLKNHYWYDGEVKETGSPKIEQLLLNNSKVRKKIKRIYNIPKSSNIILYAPTFRSEDSLKSYDIDFLKLQKTLQKRYNKNWVVLFRLHPNLKKQISNNTRNINYIDVTEYSDMQDLLRASDILITDYSGTMFEYLYTNKPVFLYANDLDKYDRGFYFDISKLPFSLSTNNEELNSNIEKFDYEIYREKIKKFKETVGLIEKYGASRKIVEIIAGK